MWGFGSSDVARAVTLTGIWNQLANLLLPVIAVLLLALDEERSALLTTVAVVGASVFTVAVVLLALVFWSDVLARGIGDACQRALNRVLRALRRDAVVEWGERLVHFRRATVDLIRRRWAWLTLAAILGNVTVFVVLLVSLRAVGIGAGEITWVEAFAGWSLARALQLIPLTPGGVGPVELGMTGILVGFGGANAEVVAAVLIYRAFTVVPTLLLGLATMAAWRWLGPDRGVAATLAPRDEVAPSAADEIADHEEPAVPEVEAVLVEPVTEPEVEQGDDLPDADRTGFLVRLLGR
jgi:uncharacterized membrane protein YbhN (UPF0104 family)